MRRSLYGGFADLLSRSSPLNGQTASPLSPPLSNQYVFYTTHFRRCFTIHHPTIYCYSSRQPPSFSFSRLESTRWSLLVYPHLFFQSLGEFYSTKFILSLTRQWTLYFSGNHISVHFVFRFVISFVKLTTCILIIYSNRI